MSDDETTGAFDAAPSTAVFTCQHVLRDGHPILRVSHDCEGDWQFSCGGNHADGSGGEPLLVCLKDMVDRDASVNDVATMCTSHSATRSAVGAAWKIEDHTVDDIRDTVNEHGVWVGVIEESDEGPAFAYTIGLYAKYKHPEIIIFGLSFESMRGILNQCADEVREGKQYEPLRDSNDVLRGCVARFHVVASEKSHVEYMGYGCRFYESTDFPVLQCVWPDKAGTFPGEAGAAEFLAKTQPLIT